MKSLVIHSDLTIFFDEFDRPQYDSGKGAALEVVQEQLYAHSAFIATWLEEVENPKAEPLNLSQRKLQKLVLPLTRSLRESFNMSNENIRPMLLRATRKLNLHFPDLSSRQLELAVDSLIGKGK